MGFLHSEICDKHLAEGYQEVYYGSFCADCDRRFDIKYPGSIKGCPCSNCGEEMVLKGNDWECQDCGQLRSIDGMLHPRDEGDEQ